MFSVLDYYNSDIFKVGEPNIDPGVCFVELHVFPFFNFMTRSLRIDVLFEEWVIFQLFIY